jgi:hypothetical protein
MEGLLLRLSALDADAENAVRVIRFFDDLVARPVDLDTLVRSTARLAGCKVGVSAPKRGLTLQADWSGEVETGAVVPTPTAVRELDDGVRVWLARAGSPIPLDDILLERFAIAAAILLNHPRVPLPELGDPALVELALSDSAGHAERSRALHLLGMAPTTPIRVLAAECEEIKDLVAALGGRANGVRHAALGRLEALLIVDPTLDVEHHAVEQARIGVSDALPAIEAPGAWRHARTALRFTASPVSGHVAWFERLGPMALLAHQLSVTDIDQLADVAALDRLAAEPSGADTIALLTALCVSDSVRKAANAVHRHHSSVAARLRRAQSVLGFPLDTPPGRFRLYLALVLRHLGRSSEQ